MVFPFLCKEFPRQISDDRRPIRTTQTRMRHLSRSLSLFFSLRCRIVTSSLFALISLHGLFIFSLVLFCLVQVDRVIESAAARDEARTQSSALAVPEFEREVSGANAIFPPSSRANSNQEEEDDERPAEEDRDQEEKATQQHPSSSYSSSAAAAASASSTIAPATPATPLANRHPSLLTAKSKSMGRAPSILHTPTAAVASTPSSIDRSIKVASSSTSPGRTRSMSAATRPSQPAPRSERSCYFASFMKTANDGSNRFCSFLSFFL